MWQEMDKDSSDRWYKMCGLAREILNQLGELPVFERERGHILFWVHPSRQQIAIDNIVEISCDQMLYANKHPFKLFIK